MKKITLLICLFISIHLFSQPFSLVKEINTTATFGSVGSLLYGKVGGQFFFVANNSINGAELWKTDGTTAGTMMVKDITAGAASTTNLAMIEAGGILIFAANNGIHGTELWRSDGTESGTYLVKDIWPGATGSSISQFFNHNGIVYFVANDGTTGLELWRSDGTEAGTYLLKDIQPGSGQSMLNQIQSNSFVSIGAYFYFPALTATDGRELWKSDGTETGTVMVKDINPTIIPGVLSQGSIGVTFKAAAHNGSLYFTASNGGGVNGTELWISDGTSAGTIMIKDISPGTGNSSPNNLISYNGFLFFTASVSNNGNASLWKSDGTAIGTTMVKDFAAEGVPFNSGTDNNNNQFTIAAGKLFFVNNSGGPQGVELYATDGTTPGTGIVKDIVPGFNPSLPVSLTQFNNLLYFSAFEQGWGGVRRLFVSDGTEAGTGFVFSGEYLNTIIAPGGGFIPSGSKFYFVGNTTEHGAELWSTDGTTAGTGIVKDINTVITGTPMSASTLFGSAVLNGNYYFSAYNDQYGQELWKSNGSTAGTVMVKDIWPGKGHSTPNWFFAAGNYVYFEAEDETNGTELWRTDGTEAGTIMIKNIWPGSGSSHPRQFATANNLIYFIADDPVGGRELWRSDGTEAGTSRIADFVPGAANGFQNASDFLGCGDFAFYIHGGKLYKVDGAAFTITELSPAITTAQDIEVIGTTLYIGGLNASFQTVLWKSENGAVPTQVKMISTTTIGFSQLTNCNGKLYFNSSNGTNGREPWISDGTDAGTYMVKDINPTGDSQPFQFKASGNKVYFSASNTFNAGTNSRDNELWITDGTDAGTMLVKDINLGLNQSRPTGTMATADGRVFFIANNDTNGYELWESNGLTTGTNMVQEFNTSGFGFNVQNSFLTNFSQDFWLTSLNNGFIFSARSADKASQLYFGTVPLRYYVNDNSLAGDVHTTAVGNNANAGTINAPYATLDYAISQVPVGATIYVDAGTYVTPNIGISKSLTILGTNYNITPNNPSDKLLINPTRNAESILIGATINLAASDISLQGLTFDPGNKVALSLNFNLISPATPQNYGNISLLKNRFKINSSLSQVIFLGVTAPGTLAGASTAVSALISTGYNVTDNRFEKENITTGFNFSIHGVKNVTIDNNSFLVTGSAVRTQGIIGIGNNSVVDNISIINNTVDKANGFVTGSRYANAVITGNKIFNSNTAFNIANSISESSGIEFSSNILDGSSGIAPSILYTRSGGASVGASSLFKAENNTITGVAVPGTTTGLGTFNTSFTNTVLNPSVIIRGNKLNYSGDLSTIEGQFIRPIVIRGNQLNTIIEKNDLDLSGINLQPANSAINLPDCAAISLYSDIGTGAILPSDAVINILNNKVNGFKQSFVVYDVSGSPGGVNPFIGYGNLPNGVTVNIKNNSFTNDVMSINNGTQSQSVNANCNWYGSVAVQNFINKLTIPTVDIAPWLSSGTDNDVATGFQPLLNSCDGYPTLVTLDNYSDVTCNGANNGTINITATYGKAPTVFTWTKDEVAVFVSHKEDPTGLAPGTYRLAITDGNGANIYIIDENADGPGTIEVTITEPDVLTASASGDNNVCFNGSIGTASVVPTGGTAPYTYLWNNEATTEEITNLIAGKYSVTVTDANGCTAQASYEVTQPSLLTASINNNSTACSNIATVVAAGGTTDYSYLWSNGATTATISSVPAGTYNVTVTDANGCTAQPSIELTVSEAFNPSASVTDVSCFGGNTGVVTVTNANGTAPFTFSIDGINFVPGSLPYSFTGLAAGTYTVAVRDINGCTGFVTKTITQPTQLIATLGTVLSTCFGLSTGSITASVAGGSPAYSYSWSEPGGYSSSQLNISNLAAGNYKLTVTDNKLCIAMLNVVVPSFNQIVVQSTVNNIACKGETTGSIILNVTGGTGNFNYLWNNGAITNFISNLSTGNYSVTITDIGSGCVASKSFTITQPSNVVALSTSKTNGTGCASLGTITATGSGGTSPYQYSLDGINYLPSGSFTGLYAGSYTVRVKDANGCIKTSAAISITDNGLDEYDGSGSNKNNTKSKAASISTGVTIAGRIATTGDPEDWYKFTVTAAGNYILSLTHPSASFTYNLFTLNNATAIGTVGSTSTSKTYSLTAGDYYIQVTGGLSYVCYQLSVNATGFLTKSIGSVPQQETVKANEKSGLFDVKVFGNPSSTGFTMNVITNSAEKMSMRVLDVQGRLIEQRQSLMPFETLRIGERYINGVYMAVIRQGKNIKIIRLVKM